MPLIKSFNPSADVNTTTDTINIPSHGFGTLDGVIYRNGGGTTVGGLVHNTKYYIIVIDTDNIKLASNEINARASTPVNLINTGSGAVHTLEFTTLYTNETAVHNIFQNIRLASGGLSNDEIISAETVKDTLNIIGGAGVSFTAVNNDTKSFTLNATQYDFEVPIATTNLRLFSDSGDDQSIILTPARGIAITRVGSQELEFESFGVTETDTLQSISERGNITNNKLIMNNLLVAKIESTPGIDGVVNYNTTGTTGTAIALTGNGTLDNELLLSPDYATSTEAAKDVYVNFQSPAAQGTLSYTAVYTSESTLTTGSVILQRNIGSGWVTIDNVSGTTVDQSYEINGNYAEILSNTVDYRILFSWTGSSDVVTYRIRVSYEVENVPGTEIIMTDTVTEVLTLGTLGGTVNIRGAINLADEINTDQLTIFNNNIVALNSDTDINLEPAGVGAVQIRSNWLGTNQSYINVFTDSQVDEVYIGSTTSLTTVNDNLRILDDVEIQGGNLTTTREAFNLFTSSRNRRSISGDRYWQFTSTEVNQSGAGDTGFWIQYLEPIPNSYIYTSTFDSSLTWGINFHQDELNVPLVPGSIPIDQSAGGDYIKLENDDIIIVFQLNGNAGYGGPGRTIYRNLVLVYSSLDTYDMAGKTFTITRGDVYNPIVPLQKLNVADAETDINLGNISINANVIGTNDSTGITITPLLTTQSDLVVENDLNVAHKITATDLELSANAVIDQNLTVLGNTTVKDIEVQGGDLTTDQTTFNLLNTTATTVNAFGAATTINFGSLIFTGNAITTDDSSGITFTPAVTFESDISVGNDIRVPTLIVSSGITSPKATITDLTSSSVTNSGILTTGSLGVNNNAIISNNLNVGGNTVITGNLTVNDTTTTNLILGDDETIQLGTDFSSSGLGIKLYVDTGTNYRHLNFYGTGGIGLIGSQSSVRIASLNGSTTSANFIIGGQTQLYYSGSQKLNTDSFGVKVSGDLQVTGTFDGDLTGNADTATALQTARNIGGVSFDGTANISLPGVDSTGNQDTSGNAATATALQTARNIAGVSFDGTANISLSSTNLNDSADLVRTDQATKFGYATGGTATQVSTDKTGTVTINALTGTVTMDNSALGANGVIQHVLSNSTVSAGDMIICTPTSGGSRSAYNIVGFCSNGSANIEVRNVSNGTLSEAIKYQFMVLKSPTS